MTSEKWPSKNEFSRCLGRHTRSELVQTLHQVVSGLYHSAVCQIRVLHAVED